MAGRKCIEKPPTRWNGLVFNAHEWAWISRRFKLNVQWVLPAFVCFFFKFQFQMIKTKKKRCNLIKPEGGDKDAQPH